MSPPSDFEQRLVHMLKEDPPSSQSILCSTVIGFVSGVVVGRVLHLSSVRVDRASKNHTYSGNTAPRWRMR